VSGGGLDRSAVEHPAFYPDKTGKPEGS